MPRNLTIKTYWTAGGDGADMCNGRLTCPGVHALADQPDLVYVICAAELSDLGDGTFIGSVPRQIHPSGRVTLTRVDDPSELTAFADHMGANEVLGTVPVYAWDGAVPVGVV